MDTVPVARVFAWAFGYLEDIFLCWKPSLSANSPRLQMVVHCQIGQSWVAKSFFSFLPQGNASVGQ